MDRNHQPWLETMNHGQKPKPWTKITKTINHGRDRNHKSWTEPKTIDRTHKSWTEPKTIDRNCKSWTKTIKNGQKQYTKS